MKTHHASSHLLSVLRVCGVVLLVTAAPDPVLATKPCLPGPCDAPGGGTDIKKCESVADWVAVGTISKVIRHEQGPPLLKDFAEFTFTVKAWEKGQGKVGQEIRFQVGWCENTRPLPKDTSGLFRFFGKALPAEPTLPNQYIHFELVTSTKP